MIIVYASSMQKPTLKRALEMVNKLNKDEIIPYLTKCGNAYLKIYNYNPEKEQKNVPAEFREKDILIRQGMKQNAMRELDILFQNIRQRAIELNVELPYKHETLEELLENLK